MKKNLMFGIIAAVVVVAIIAGIIFAARPSVPSTSSNTESAASANTPVQEGIIEMKIENFSFVPTELKIRVGSKVTWVNKDVTQHQLISDYQGRAEISSSSLGQGESYSHVFNLVGVYNYHCALHPGMKGKIVVVE